MSWAPIEGTQTRKPLTDTATTHFEVSNDFLDERGGHAERVAIGPLCRVRMPDDYNYKNWKVDPKHIRVYDVIERTFGYDFFSYQKIKAIFHNYHPRALSIALSVLWAHGYIEKFAKGEYVRGWSGKNKGKVGKYHGVYYRAIPIQDR